MKSDSFVIFFAFSFALLSKVCYRITGRFYFSFIFPCLVFFAGVFYDYFSPGWYSDLFESFLFSLSCWILIVVVSVFFRKRSDFCEVDKP